MDTLKPLSQQVPPSALPICLPGLPLSVPCHFTPVVYSLPSLPTLALLPPSLPLSLPPCLQTLPALVELVCHEDVAVKVDACWALSFLADGKEKQIQVSGTHWLYRTTPALLALVVAMFGGMCVLIGLGGCVCAHEKMTHEKMTPCISVYMCVCDNGYDSHPWLANYSHTQIVWHTWYDTRALR